MAKLLTTKWPLSSFLAELAAQLEARDLLLDVAWVPRELNAEADAITNGETSWLAPSLRVKIQIEKLPFIILNKLLKAGGEIYRDLEVANVEGVLPAKKGSALLKVRAPWG